MYRAARELLASAPRPGDERTRVSHICHSMREIMNRLPGALGIVGTGGGGPRSSTHVRKLPALAARFPNLDLRQEVENVPVPQELAVLLDELVKAAVAEDGRVAANAAALLTDDGNTKHPVVRDWRTINDYFVKWAHLHDEQSDPELIPSDDDLRQRIELAEALMDGIRLSSSTACTQSRTCLQRPIRSAREAKTMTEYQAPTAEQVQAALRRLTSFQLRRAFYEGSRIRFGSSRSLMPGPSAARPNLRSEATASFASDTGQKLAIWMRWRSMFRARLRTFLSLLPAAVTPGSGESHSLLARVCPRPSQPN